MERIIKYKFIDGVANRYGIVVKEDEKNITIKRLNDTDQFEIAKSEIEILPFLRKDTDKKVKICAMCSVEKNIKDFAKHDENSYRKYCKECYTIQNKKYPKKKQPYNPLQYLEQREHILAKHKRWRDKKKLEQQDLLPKKKTGRPRKVATLPGEEPPSVDPTQ